MSNASRTASRKNARKSALVTNEIKRLKRQMNIKPYECTMELHDHCKAIAHLTFGIKSHKPLSGDRYELIEAGFISWPGYDKAIVRPCATEVKMTDSGDTMVRLGDRIFNCHPCQFSAGWTPTKRHDIRFGCYPVRMEIAAYNWEMENQTADEYWESL